MQILAIGDMHLGRRPSRLPSELAHRAQALGPAAAWRKAVDSAIRMGVKAVLLAGDLVEKEDDFFEAFKELEQGVRRLAKEHIEVIAVVGNHDVQVLPRLAEQISELHILGQGGQWAQRKIEDGRETVTLWGWSFAQAQVHQSPLAGMHFERGPGTNLGLLHCDRDATSGPYAPVARLDLERAGLDGWLLGHIHKPDALAAPRPSGYLGSLVGLDRSELGQHGPWLITIAGGGIKEVAQLPLAPLRWERLDVPLDDINHPDEAVSLLFEEIRKLDKKIERAAKAARKLDDQIDSALAVGLRVIFSGRTNFGTAAIDSIPPKDWGTLPVDASDRHYFIAKLSADTKPDIDLRQLAEQSSPPGLLAKRLLLLDEPTGHPERDELVDEAQKRLRGQAGNPHWKGLDDAVPDAVAWLRDAGFRALDRLLEQMAEND